MIFDNIPDSVETNLTSDGIHYLYANTTMFGELKLGDLMMYSCLLRFLKSALIKKFPDKYSEHTLYFVLNRLGGLKVDQIRSMMSLMPSIWGGSTVTDTITCNIKQCLTGGNLWAFKCYLEECGISLTDINKNVIELGNTFCLTDEDKKDIYIMPVHGKQYNKVRNMSEKDIIRLVNSLPDSDRTINVIVKDSKLNKNYLLLHGRNRLTLIDHGMTWHEIVMNIISNCRLYISGDCGLTHLVSMICPKYKPEMRIYYNTSNHYIKKINNEFDKKCRTVNFKPFIANGSDDVQIIKQI